MFRYCLVAALLLTPFVDLIAQKAVVAPGNWVQVKAPTIVPDPIVGTVVALDTSRLLLQVKGGQVIGLLEIERVDLLFVDETPRLRLAVPLASITRLLVFQEGNRGVAGLLIGAGAGAVTGGLLGYAGGEDCSGDEFLCFGRTTRDEATVAGALILGVVGAGIGLVVGLNIKSGHGSWDAVPLERIRVGLTRHGDPGLAVSVAVAF